MDKVNQLIADTFAKNYGEINDLMQADIRWDKLAREAVEKMKKADEEKWSDEKLSDFLDSSLEETIQTRKRYRIAKKIEAAPSPAERMVVVLQEILKTEAGLEKDQIRKLIPVLCRHLGNELKLLEPIPDQLSVTIQELFLKSKSTPLDLPMPDLSNQEAPPPQWGPQWKD